MDRISYCVLRQIKNAIFGAVNMFLDCLDITVLYFGSFLCLAGRSTSRLFLRDAGPNRADQEGEEVMHRNNI